MKILVEAQNEEIAKMNFEETSHPVAGLDNSYN
jgi:hypothetical protein